MTTSSSRHESDGVRARYRRWYETLPTPLRMIGLQAWLPAFFLIAFVFCYLFAFHAPVLKDVPVAIVGESTSVTAMAHQIEASSEGKVSVSVVDTMADAKERVAHGNLAAAYAPGRDGEAHLVVASADGYQLASLTQQFFQPVAAASGSSLTVDDLAPLPANDAFGSTLFYLTLVCIIVGYMMGMFVGMMGAALKHWQRFAVVAGASVTFSLVVALLSSYVVRVVDGHFWELWLIGGATSLAVGLAVNALAYFFGRFVTGAALVVFVFLNVPASGGAYPPELVPQPFRFLHEFVIGTGTLNLLRRAVYDIGPAEWHGWLLIGSYAIGGVALALVGKPYFLARSRRRRAEGKISMMVAAQIASLTHAGYVQPVGDAAAQLADASLSASERRNQDAARGSSDSAEEVDGDTAAAGAGVAG